MQLQARSILSHSMSDAAVLYEVVFKLVYECMPDLRLEHRITLSQLITGILRGANVQLHQVARKLRYKGKKTSLIDKFRRFLRNKKIKVEGLFLPFVEMIIEALKEQEEIILIIDTTKVGGNCMCLMLSVYYKGRALPLCWLAYKGKKGHSSSQLQLELLEMIFKMLPNNKKITLLGDGEFDSAEVIKWLEAKPNWEYVCPTATNIKVFYQNEWVFLSDLPLAPEKNAFFVGLLFTESQKVGPINVLAWWNEKEKRHVFLVTNMTTFEQAQKWYRLRFTIETLFSDVKGRGFNLNKTRLRHPKRVERLIMACAMAYVFTIFLGVESIVVGEVDEIVRLGDSWYDSYYSLFQIGLSYLDHLLNERLPFPTGFQLRPPDQFHHGSVI